MEDHNLITDQEDPIVMYLIVKEALGMSIGKTAAQCAHASQLLQLKYHNYNSEIESYADPEYGMSKESYDAIPAELKNNIDIFYKWMNSSYRKVVLRSKDKNWEKIKEVCPNHVVVIDAGLTEIAAGSETVIGLWPMLKSECPKLIKKLQVLK